MNKTWLNTLSAIILACSAQQGLAAKPQQSSLTKQPKPRPVVAKQWRGAYVGAHIGTVLGKFDVNSPFNTSIFGDTLRTPGFLGGLQAGYNWQADNSNIVWGLEADISGMDADGSGTCFAYTGRYVSANGTADPDFSAKLTGRVGMTFGANQRSLLYIKAGAALLNNELSAVNNNLFGILPATKKSTVTTEWGPTVGAGIEFAMSPACSLKLEYDYLHVADVDLDAPASILITEDYEDAMLTSSAHASIKQDMHQIMLGFNYHVTPHQENHCFLPRYWLHGAPNHFLGQNGWQLETGLRYFQSWGRFQKDLPAGGLSTSLISRLTYDDVDTYSGELFARFDHSSKIFVKAMVGTGRITSGDMNDEDWGIGVNDLPAAYSNTFSDLDHSDIHYASLDIGYNFLSGCDYRLGALIGYHFSKEEYGATDYVRVSPRIFNDMTSNQPVITETDKWHSLRLGFSAQAWLAAHFRLDVDCAYLPYIKFKGEDDHWLRGLIITETSCGRGVQFEAVANYCFTPRANIGLGGRYWAAWATEGDDVFTSETGESIKPKRVDTYRLERYGVFLQASYQFGC